MAAFTYKALDTSGQFVTGEVRAVSVNAALQQLIELGYRPLSALPSGTDSRKGWLSLIPQPSISKRDVTTLLQDLALLLRSGLPLDEGLQLLTENASSATSRLITQLRMAIGSGANFAEALQSNPATALPELIAVVRSAEATGNLEQALETIARERLKQEQISARVRAAVRYPIFLLLVSIGVLSFFLLFVVPQFADVVQNFGTRPDPFVGTVIAISNGLRQSGDVIGGILLAAAGIIALAWRTPRFRKRILAPLAYMPLVHGILTLRTTANFCRSLGTLLSNGVNLTDALRLMSESGIGGDRLAIVSDRVRRGGRLVDSVTEAKLIPLLAARMLRVGEESGSLGAVATRCAEYYEAKMTDQIDKLTGIVGPAAIVFIAAVVGTLIVSIMSTLLSINQMVM